MTNQLFTEVETKYILLHTSWESIELAWYGQGVDTQDKWAGKATTYALKNTLLNMFLIPTWVDTDNTHSDDWEVPKIASDDLPWITQDNIDNIDKLINSWKIISMLDIRKKYKVSKQNAEINSYLGYDDDDLIVVARRDDADLVNSVYSKFI